jgi:hypothetical protein
MAVFSCNQIIDLYEIIIQNNSSSVVSGVISVIDEGDRLFTVSAGRSDTLGVSAPYTVSYKNQYGRILGTIDYLSNKVIFMDNPGISLTLTNNISEDVYLFTGGYIQGEIITDGDYKVDGTEGFKISSSGSTSTMIYSFNPSFVAKTASNIIVRISWTINTTGISTMSGVINY